MKVEHEGDGRPLANPQHEGQRLSAAPEPEGRNGDRVSATDLLVELAQCQRSIRSLLRAAIGGLVPASNQTLPAVSSTLSGLIQATDMAANKVLDHAEGLAGDRERLGKALARLEPLLDTADPTTRRAWLDIVECSHMLSGRVISIMSGMAFQDLTSQQLTGAVKSVEEMRQQLTQILALLDLPVAPEEPDAGADGDRRPRPSFRVDGQQALADRLWAELKEE